MTEAEKTARAVLAAAALVDHRIREPDPNVIRAWARILGDIDQQHALDAVVRHYRTETRVLLPADVLERQAVGNDPDRSPAYRPVREVLAELDRKALGA
jgi:hypothetical protein